MPSTVRFGPLEGFEETHARARGRAGAVTDEREVDVQLVAVLNEVLDAVYQAKQAAWSATTSPAREDLRESWFRS